MASMRPTKFTAVEQQLQTVFDHLKKLECASAAAAVENERLSEIRLDLDPSAAERVEEVEFEAKVQLSRIRSAVAGALPALQAALASADVVRLHIDAVEKECHELRSTVARLEATRQVERGGLVAAMETTHRLGAGPSPTGVGMAPMLKSTVPTPDCNCHSVVPTTSSHGCVHREILATNVIDQAFEGHRRLLRQRLADAERRIQDLENGAAFKAAAAREAQLKVELERLQTEFEAQRIKWTAAIGAASRMVSVQATLPPGRVEPRLDPLLVTVCQQHAFMLMALREAHYDMKLLLAANNGFTSAARARIPTPPSQTLEVDTLERDVRTRRARFKMDAVGAAPRARRQEVDAAVQMAESVSREGGSGVTSKPLHPRARAMLK